MIHKIYDTKNKLKGMILVCKFDPNNNQNYNPEIPKGVFAIYFNTFVNKKTGKDVINNCTYNFLQDEKRKGIASNGKLWMKVGHLVDCEFIEKTIKKSDEIFSKVKPSDLEKVHTETATTTKPKTKAKDQGINLDNFNDQQVNQLLVQLLERTGTND